MKLQLFAQIIVRRRVLYALTVLACLTFTSSSPCAEPVFSTKPWRGAKSTLTPDYLGVDLELLMESLTPKKVAPKDEFESTDEYAARVKALKESWSSEPLYGEIKRGSRVAVVARTSETFQSVPSQTFSLKSTYDADAKRVSVQIDFPLPPSVSLDGTRSVPVETRGETHFMLVYESPKGRENAGLRKEPRTIYLTGVDAERARALKDQIGAAIVFTPKCESNDDATVFAYSASNLDFSDDDESEATVEPTATPESAATTDLEEDFASISARDVELWLYDRTTMAPLAAMPLDHAITALSKTPRFRLPRGGGMMGAGDYFVDAPPFEIPLGARIAAADDVASEDVASGGASGSDANSQAALKENESTRSVVNTDVWRMYRNDTKINVQSWETRKPSTTLSESDKLNAISYGYGVMDSKAVAVPAGTTISVDFLNSKYFIPADGVAFLGTGEKGVRSTLEFGSGDYILIPKGRRAYFKNIRFVFDKIASDTDNPFFVICGAATFKDCEFVGIPTNERELILVNRGTVEFTRCNFREFGDCAVGVQQGRLNATLCEFDGSYGKKRSPSSKTSIYDYSYPSSYSSSVRSATPKINKSVGIFCLESKHVEIDKTYFHHCFVAGASDAKGKTVIRDSFFANNFCDFKGSNALLIQNQMWNHKEKDWKPLRLDPKLLK